MELVSAFHEPSRERSSARSASSMRSEPNATLGSRSTNSTIPLHVSIQAVQAWRRASAMSRRSRSGGTKSTCRFTATAEPSLLACETIHRIPGSEDVSSVSSSLQARPRNSRPKWVSISILRTRLRYSMSRSRIAMRPSRSFGSSERWTDRSRVAAFR